jgi:hypothetical protein
MIPATPAKSTPSSAVEPPGLVMHPPEEPLLLDVLTVLPDPASVFPLFPALDVLVAPLPELLTTGLLPCPELVERQPPVIWKIVSWLSQASAFPPLTRVAHPDWSVAGRVAQHVASAAHPPPPEVLVAEAEPVPLPPETSQRRHGELVVPQGPLVPPSQS